MRPVEPPAAPLTDGVVTVRLRRVEDVGAIAEASRDPDTRRWLDDVPMDAGDRAAGMERVERAWREGSGAPMVVADAATDEAIGLVNLQFRDRGTTIAYSVFPAHRGKGVAPRAVELVAAWALNDLGLAELLLEVHPDNVASVRVAQKAGFVEQVARQGEDGTVTRVFARRS